MIGTKEVIGLKDHQGRASIYSTISSSSNDVEAGIDGDGNASLKDIWIQVKGRCTKNNRVIGFEQCNCTGCKAVVVGADGEKGTDYAGRDLGRNYPGGKGSDGAAAYGFWGCNLNNCQADVTGGNGGEGGQGADANGDLFNLDLNSSNGGDGGYGGASYSCYNCSFQGNGFTEQRIVGGNGGLGGFCGTPKEAISVGSAGQVGNNGNGGNAYVYSSYPYNAMGGRAYLGRFITFTAKNGAVVQERKGKDGETGMIIKL